VVGAKTSLAEKKIRGGNRDGGGKRTANAFSAVPSWTRRGGTDLGGVGGPRCREGKGLKERELAQSRKKRPRANKKHRRGNRGQRNCSGATLHFAGVPKNRGL